MEIRRTSGNPAAGPMFVSPVGKPMNLDAVVRKSIRLIRAKAVYLARFPAWTGFNLNRLGIDDGIIQAILRHSDVALTSAATSRQ